MGAVGLEPAETEVEGFTVFSDHTVTFFQLFVLRQLPDLASWFGQRPHR